VSRRENCSASRSSPQAPRTELSRLRAELLANAVQRLTRLLFFKADGSVPVDDYIGG
jgi:hypothetical protein